MRVDIRTEDTLASARAATPAALLKGTILVLENGRHYRWDGASTTADDGTATSAALAVSGVATGRWLLRPAPAYDTLSRLVNAEGFRTGPATVNLDANAFGTMQSCAGTGTLTIVPPVVTGQDHARKFIGFRVSPSATVTVVIDPAESIDGGGSVTLIAGEALIIEATSTNYVIVEKYDKATLAALNAHLADTVDAHDASAISYAGGTGMSASEVEGAIDELATEKADATALTAHIDDTVDAHDASAISYAGGTGMSATEVEGAIDELATEKADATALTNHLNDTVDAHDASAISFAPTGTVAATDVQAAIAEVASEGGGEGGVTSVEGQTGAVDVAGTGGIGISASAGTVTIDGSGLGGQATGMTTVDTVAALRTVATGSLSTGTVRRVLGYSSATDRCPPRDFRLNKSSSTGHNGGTIITSTDAGGGRWERLGDTRDLNVLEFGAVADYAGNPTTCTDNQPFFAAAMSVALTTSIRGKLFIPAGNYGFRTTWDVTNFRGTIEGVGTVGGKSEAKGSSSMGSNLVGCTDGMDLIAYQPNATSTSNVASGNNVWWGVNFINHFPTTGTAGYSTTAARSGRGVHLKLTNDFKFILCAFRDWAEGLVIDAMDDDNAGSTDPATLVNGGDAAWGTVYDCTFQNNMKGIYSKHGGGATIDNGKYFVELHGSWGIHITTGSQWRIHNIKFDGNSTATATEGGGCIWFQGCYGLISNNHMEDGYIGCRIDLPAQPGHPDDGWGNVLHGNRIVGAWFPYELGPGSGTSTGVRYTQLIGTTYKNVRSTPDTYVNEPNGASANTKRMDMFTNYPA